MLVCAFPCMRFVRIECNNLASCSGMKRSPVEKAFGTRFNHTYGHAFVRMFGKRVGDVPCMEKLDIAQIIRTPYFGALALVKRIIVAFHIEQSLWEQLDGDPNRWRVNKADKNLRSPASA